MTLWARTQQLTGNYLRQVQELYSSRFPMEVRHSIANWLETQNWKTVDENNDEALAYFYLEQMEQQINEKAMSFTGDEQSFPYMLRLRESANLLKMAYKDSPLELVRIIRESLYREQQLVMMSSGEPMKQENQVSQTERQILKDMEVLRKAVMDAGCYVKEMHQKHEYFVIQYQHNQKIEDAVKILSSQSQTSQKQAQIKKLEGENKNLKEVLRNGARELNDKRGTMYEHMANMMKLFKSLSHMVFDIELVAWKNLQKKATFKTDLIEAHVLNKIQRWCEELASLLNDCKQQVMKLQMLEGEIPSVSEKQNKIEELDRELRDFLKDLLLKSFVVNQQPPQVVRKDARFTANVRLLVGHKLNVFMSMPTVEASIISEPQARAIACEGCIPEGTENAGDILNNKGTMEYSQGQMSVTFRNMQLKKIKRADRKGQELVVEEKFCLLFRAKIQADMKYETWTMSLPIVVTVHGNQECQAQATILWDNAFSDPMRIPFAVPDQVTWNDLSSLLSYWYQSKTGSCLNYDHLQIVAAKLFGEGLQDYSACMVTRSQFHKDHLQPGKWNFSLWEWLYLVQKVTKEFLQQPWVDGLIMGFVSKKMAQQLLMAKPPGTFLLRYSDGELGGISIVYNHPDKDNKMQVSNLCPFTDRDFRIRCLADRIQDLRNLLYLYPSTPKEVAFGKYWTRSSNTLQTNEPGVYVPHTLTMNILGVDTNNEEAQMQHIQQPMSNMTVNSMDMDYPDDDLASYLSPVSNPDFVPNSDFVANPEYQGNGDFATNEFNLAYLS